MTAKIADYIEQEHAAFVHNVFEYSVDKKHRLGTRRVLEDGRAFVYAQLGAANSVAGAWYQTAAGAGMAEDTVTVAHGVGTKEVTITEVGSATGREKNYFEDGILVVDAGSGLGEMYKIKGNQAMANGATGKVLLYDGLATAWSTSTTNVHLFINPYKGVVIGDYDVLTECVVGVFPRIYPANSYCWVQDEGLAALLIDDVDAANGAGGELDERLVVVSNETDGYGLIGWGMANGDANTDAAHWIRHLGYLVPTGNVVDKEAHLVFLSLRM